MKSERRSSGSSRALLRVAAALALLVCPGAPAPRTQEVEDITGAIEKYRTILALANQKLDDLDLAEALARFTEVVDGYKAGKLPTGTPLTRQIVGQAYEGLARTHANLGKSAEAEADFEALIRFDVTWPVDRTRTSPKIIALYDKVRKRIVGTLAIKTEPPGAAVTLNGEPIGRSPVFDRELTSGQYTVLAEAAGYDSITETITLDGGARLEKALRLTPNARSILVATSPAGARILIGSQERGTTFGVAGPEYAEWASRLAVSPAEISAPLLVEHLAPGNHMLKIEKECFEPQLLSIVIAIDPNDNSPVPFEPIRLSPSLGSLNLDSTPPGAEALLDGKPVGKTPAKLDGICTGRHEVVLRHVGVGQWIGQVEVSRGQRATLSQRPRMTLAYVGMTTPGPAGQPPMGEEEIGKALTALESYNVLLPGSGIPEELLARRRQALGDDLPGDYLDAVAARTGADLVLAALPGEGGFEKRCDVVLYPTRPALRRLRDRVRISLEPRDREGELKDLIEKLEVVPLLASPWIGLRAIDLYGGANPLVVRVSPGGPAAAAGVKVGDAIISLGGRPAGSARDLEAAVAAMKEGTQASLALQAPGEKVRQANLVIASTPVVVPPYQTGRLVSRAATDLFFRAGLEAAEGRPVSGERTAALLSLSLLMMRADLYEGALDEALARTQPAKGPGLSAGTVAYLKGIAFWRLNRISDSRQQLTSAAEELDATLWRNDGPPVAERARRLLAVLPPG